MSKEQFKDHKFNKWSLEVLALCNQIIDQYTAQGFKLTLRQLYYQLVTRNAIPNSEKMYGKISRTLSDARLAGLVDWDAIEDRIRQPRRSSEWDSLKDLMRSALYAYRLPRWKGQAQYVELWVEKDALSGVLQPLAAEYHVTMMVNRGYSSQSAMYDASKRFHSAPVAQDCDLDGCTLLYLGDHDPSGEDMVRDIKDRLEMFGVENLEVRKLALTMDQVEKYNPPPNPAKMSDSRAAEYVEKHGSSSWEVDALPPEVLQQIIRDALDGLVDHDRMDRIKDREKQDKKDLEKAVDAIMNKRKKSDEE